MREEYRCWWIPQIQGNLATGGVETDSEFVTGLLSLVNIQVTDYALNIYIIVCFISINIPNHQLLSVVLII